MKFGRMLAFYIAALVACTIANNAIAAPVTVKYESAGEATGSVMNGSAVLQAMVLHTMATPGMAVEETEQASFAFEKNLAVSVEPTGAQAQAAGKPIEIVTTSIPGSPVPEPATWAMLLLGVGAVTLRIRGMGNRSSRIR